MPLQQTVEIPVEIPASRRFTIEVPRGTPTGAANVIIQFPVKPAKKVMTEAEEIEAINRFAKMHEKEILENLEYQADIFEAGDPDL